MKKLIRFLTSRLFIFSVLILVQFLLLAGAVLLLANNYVHLYALFTVLSLAIVVWVVNETDNPMFKVAWIIPILLFPVFGGVFYAVFGRRKLPRTSRLRFEESQRASQQFIALSPVGIAMIERSSPMAAKQARYLSHAAHSAICTRTETEYLSIGEMYLDRLLNDLRKAKRFIFLQYFIIKEGTMWDAILEILREKQAAGVEIRILYDDLGAINEQPPRFAQKLREFGFKTAVFNPFRPSLDVFMNYRDHRKIVVVDGQVAFTGGINIADEYINAITRFGHWKDTGIRLEGDAVDKLTLIFLQAWHFATGELPNYKQYLIAEPRGCDGFVLPFDDGPHDDHLLSEMAYISVINNARRYVHISTPYLILDNEMTTALCLAAESGVDVRIITPFVADKKLVRSVTRSNYKALLKRGVRIHEYTPGFMHSKTIVADGEIAIIGTTNFDFRSFYLHFEDNVWLYGSRSVAQAEQDFQLSLAVSHEVDLEWYGKLPISSRIVSSFLKLFSPLM